MSTNREKVNSVMSIDPKNITEKQYEVLREYTISVLEDALNLIKEEKYDDVRLDYSPAGDGYGKDNAYIDFRFSQADRNGYVEIEDIGDVLEELIRLKKINS